MTTIKANTIKLINTKSVMVLAFVLFLFSSAQVVAQENNVEITNNIESVKTSSVATNVENSSNTNSDMEFISWFMGTEQKLNIIESDNSTVRESSKTKKKQMISSGIAPNRILYKVILKKMVNQDVANA